MKNIILGLLVLGAGSAQAATPELAVSMGTAAYDFQAVEDDYQAEQWEAALMFTNATDLANLSYGLGLNRNTFSIDGDLEEVTYNFTDLTAIGQIDLGKGDFRPYAKLELILGSTGKVRGQDWSKDLDNSGFALSGGIKVASTDKISFHIETAIQADKEIKVSRNDEVSTHKYSYGALESYKFGVQVAL